MPDHEGPQPISVNEARRIGLDYGQSIVIILGFNPDQSYATTWGRSAQDKIQAKTWSDDIMLHMSCQPVSREQLEQSFEDFRDAAQTALKVDELCRQLAEEQTKLPERYEDLIDGLAQLPETQLPGLLNAVVKQGYARNVFQPGGAGRLVQKLEARLGQS